MTRWLAAFALTQAVEIPIVWRAMPERGRGARLAIAAAASTLTHPVAWFVLPRLLPTGGIPRLLLIEAFVVVAEALWLRAFGVPRALWWSLLANSLSVAAGLAMQTVLGWSSTRANVGLLP